MEFNPFNCTSFIAPMYDQMQGVVYQALPEVKLPPPPPRNPFPSGLLPPIKGLFNPLVAEIGFKLPEIGRIDTGGMTMNEVNQIKVERNQKVRSRGLDGRELNVPRLRDSPWTFKEDRLIRTHVEVFGPDKWAMLAREINSNCHDDEITRSRQKVRERWFNHLNPEVTRKF
jgi:hypothetical protein